MRYKKANMIYNIKDSYYHAFLKGGYLSIGALLDDTRPSAPVCRTERHSYGGTPKS